MKLVHDSGTYNLHSLLNSNFKCSIVLNSKKNITAEKK